MDNSPLETDDTLSLPIGNVEGRIITRGSKLYHYRKASRGIAYKKHSKLHLISVAPFKRKKKKMIPRKAKRSNKPNKDS